MAHPLPYLWQSLTQTYVFLALCKAVEQLGSGSGGQDHGTSHCPPGMVTPELCRGSRSQFKDSSFQRGFASRAWLFRNPMFFKVLYLNGPPPPPVMDLGLCVGAPGGNRRGEGGSHTVRGLRAALGRGSRWCCGARTFPEPRSTSSAPLSLCLGEVKQEDEVMQKIHPHKG